MKIYADNAATTRPSKTAISVMMKALEDVYGNPSSLYSTGQEAREALEQARADVAAVINAEPREILFTSGGSEADNQALRSAASICVRYGAQGKNRGCFSLAAALGGAEGAFSSV